MNIEEKYRIKYLISLFKQVQKQLSHNTDPVYMDTDPEIADTIDSILRKTYGYEDQNERDYLSAAFMKNFYRTGGDFDKLGKSVKPFTPQLTTFKIEEYEWCEVKVTNYYNVETYSQAQATSLLYNGWLEADDSETQFIECPDREIEINEAPKREEKIDEDLEYWGANTKGPEDAEYGIGPSE